jgi:hypothetical protein
MENILFSKSHNQHHLKRYIKLMGAWKDQNLEVFHVHHICPKAKDLFPEYANLKKHPWNGIKLSPRQHYIAHRILWKAYGGSQTKAFAMAFTKYSKSSKAYGQAREEFSKLMKQPRTAKWKANISKGRMRPLSAEGIIFESQLAAAAHFGISQFSVFNRLRSKNFPTWFRLE